VMALATARASAAGASNKFSKTTIVASVAGASLIVGLVAMTVRKTCFKGAQHE